MVTICCPYGQSISPIGHVVRVYHDILYQSILFTWSPYVAHMVRVYRILVMWSECITIYCINPYCSHGHHMLPIWSECIAYWPCGQCVSQYIVSIHTVHIASMSRHTMYQIILSTWSECLTIYCIDSYCLHGQHVSAYIAPCGQSVSPCSHSRHVSPYDAHVVRVSHHILYQFILFT